MIVRFFFFRPIVKLLMWDFTISLLPTCSIRQISWNFPEFSLNFLQNTSYPTPTPTYQIPHPPISFTFSKKSYFLTDFFRIPFSCFDLLNYTIISHQFQLWSQFQIVLRVCIFLLYIHQYILIYGGMRDDIRKIFPFFLYLHACDTKFLTTDIVRIFF